MHLACIKPLSLTRAHNTLGVLYAPLRFTSRLSLSLNTLSGEDAASPAGRDLTSSRDHALAAGEMVGEYTEGANPHLKQIIVWKKDLHTLQAVASLGVPAVSVRSERVRMPLFHPLLLLPIGAALAVVLVIF